MAVVSLFLSEHGRCSPNGKGNGKGNDNGFNSFVILNSCLFILFHFSGTEKGTVTATGMMVLNF